MTGLNCFAIFCFLILVVNNSIGLKWVTISSGDPIPANAVRLSDKDYVGRARHYDEILVASVNLTAAVVSSCGSLIDKHRFDVLVSRDPCRWELFAQIDKVPQFIARGGTASDGEPIYIGRSKNAYAFSIESIFLLSTLKNRWIPSNMAALICNDKSNWIDTDASKIPNNTVKGGVSASGKKQYVARLKSGCSIIPGSVIPEAGIASAEYDGESIYSSYCQVLVGEKNEYKWLSTLHGQIPDYAVVSSRDRNGELMYVARNNSTLGYLTQSLYNHLNTSYEILVKNEQFYDQ